MESTNSAKKFRLIGASSPVDVTHCFSPILSATHVFDSFTILLNFLIQKAALERILKIIEVSNELEASKKRSHLTIHDWINLIVEYAKLKERIEEDSTYILFIEMSYKNPNYVPIFLTQRAKEYLLERLDGKSPKINMQSIEPLIIEMLSKEKYQRIYRRFCELNTKKIQGMIKLHDERPDFYHAVVNRFKTNKEKIHEIRAFFIRDQQRIQRRAVELISLIDEAFLNLKSFKLDFHPQLVEEMAQISQDFKLDIEKTYLSSILESIANIENPQVLFDTHPSNHLSTGTSNVLDTADYNQFIEIDEHPETYHLMIHYPLFSIGFYGQFENLILSQFILNQVKDYLVIEPQSISSICRVI